MSTPEDVPAERAERDHQYDRLRLLACTVVALAALATVTVVALADAPGQYFVYGIAAVLGGMAVASL